MVCLRQRTQAQVDIGSFMDLQSRIALGPAVTHERTPTRLGRPWHRPSVLEEVSMVDIVMGMCMTSFSLLGSYVCSIRCQKNVMLHAVSSGTFRQYGRSHIESRWYIALSDLVASSLYLFEQVGSALWAGICRHNGGNKCINEQCIRSWHRWSRTTILQVTPQNMRYAAWPRHRPGICADLYPNRLFHVRTVHRGSFFAHWSLVSPAAWCISYFYSFARSSHPRLLLHLQPLGTLEPVFWC